MHTTVLGSLATLVQWGPNHLGSPSLFALYPHTRLHLRQPVQPRLAYHSDEVHAGHVLRSILVGNWFYSSSFSPSHAPSKSSERFTSQLVCCDDKNLIGIAVRHIDNPKITSAPGPSNRNALPLPAWSVFVRRHQDFLDFTLLDPMREYMRIAGFTINKESEVHSFDFQASCHAIQNAFPAPSDTPDYV